MHLALWIAAGMAAYDAFLHLQGVFFKPRFCPYFKTLAGYNLFGFCYHLTVAGLIYLSIRGQL